MPHDPKSTRRRREAFDALPSRDAARPVVQRVVAGELPGLMPHGRVSAFDDLTAGLMDLDLSAPAHTAFDAQRAPVQRKPATTSQVETGGERDDVRGALEFSFDVADMLVQKQSQLRDNYEVRLAALEAEVENRRAHAAEHVFDIDTTGRNQRSVESAEADVEQLDGMFHARTRQLERLVAEVDELQTRVHHHIDERDVRGAEHDAAQGDHFELRRQMIRLEENVRHFDVDFEFCNVGYQDHRGAGDRRATLLGHTNEDGEFREVSEVSEIDPAVGPVEVGNGTVTAHTGLHIEHHNDHSVVPEVGEDAWALSYEGPDARQHVWVQVVWLEMIGVFVDAEGNEHVESPPEGRETGYIESQNRTVTFTPGGTQDELGEPRAEHLFVDSRNPSNPDYVGMGGVADLSDDVLRMFDAPSPADTSWDEARWNAIERNLSITTFIERFHAETYLMRVEDAPHPQGSAISPVAVCRVDMEWQSDSKPGSANVNVSECIPVSRLSASRRALIERQVNKNNCVED